MHFEQAKVNKSEGKKVKIIPSSMPNKFHSLNYYWFLHVGQVNYYSAKDVSTFYEWIGRQIIFW